jgi:hypothetical protein
VRQHLANPLPFEGDERAVGVAPKPRHVHGARSAAPRQLLLEPSQALAELPQFRACRLEPAHPVPGDRGGSDEKRDYD